MEQITLAPPRGLVTWAQLYFLYRTSFPRAERKPFFVIYKAFRAGKTDIFCIQQQGAFLGFAATMKGDTHVMLDYFVIHPRHRGRGIGSAALKQILALHRDVGFFLEIESPYEPGPEQTHCQKRKQFYVNCGLESLHIMADVFGIPMELLGINCDLDFPRYRNFYRDFYKPWAADHIKELPAPEKWT